MSNYGLATDSYTTNEASCIAGTPVDGNTTTFVMRYYHPGGSGSVTPAEGSALASKGIRVGALWETGSSGNETYFTYDNGVNDGEAAFKYAALTMGQHGGTPVYFAVDFDATSSGSVIPYFNGVHQGYLNYVKLLESLGIPVIAYDVGVYGSYWVLGWCKDDGVATYFYQAYAPGWSGGENAGQWPDDNIRQLSAQITVCGLAVNRLEAWGNEGAWLE